MIESLNISRAIPRLEPDRVVIVAGGLHRLFLPFDWRSCPTHILNHTISGDSGKRFVVSWYRVVAIVVRPLPYGLLWGWIFGRGSSDVGQGSDAWP